MAGQIVERVLGGARMLLVSVGAAIAGSLASALLLPWLGAQGWTQLAIIAPTAANLMAVGSIVAALWLLLPRYTPPLEPRMRRNLAVTLALLLLANVLTGWPELAAARVAPVALAVTCLVSSLVVWTLPVSLPRMARGALVFVAAALGLASVASFVAIIPETPQAQLSAQRDQRCTIDSMVLRTPLTHAPVSLDRQAPYLVPVIDGLVDSLELRAGGLVQIGATTQAAGSEGLALFDVVEGLEHELSVTAAGAMPEPYAALLAQQGIAERGGAEQGAATWRSADLWRNGERVARVVERRLAPGPTGEVAVVYLVASPASAIHHGAELHAAILADATTDPTLERSATARCTLDP